MILMAGFAEEKATSAKKGHSESGNGRQDGERGGK